MCKKGADTMHIYNMECLSQRELITQLALEIRMKKGRLKETQFMSFVGACTYKADILQFASQFIEIECKESVENCLYCEDPLTHEGLYCDDLCQTLHQEENVTHVKMHQKRVQV